MLPSQRAVPVYPDHSRLMVYQDADGIEHPVRSLKDWNIRRQHILAGMQQVMGPLPTALRKVPLDVQISDRVKGDGYTRLTLTYRADVADRVPAYLYLPDPRDGQATSERLPAMLVLHSSYPIGKAAVDGQSMTFNRAHARELAQRGYVVLAPDYPPFGDYKDYDFDADDYVSGTMKGIVNHMRGVDLLQARPEVDPERIGVMGHSLGGHNAMFVGVFDERLKVVVSSCGWTPFHDYYSGNLSGWAGPRYMPRIRDVYSLDPDRIPFDFYEVVAALAPRAFFTNSPLGDSNFTVAGVKKAIKAAKAVYELHGVGDLLQACHPDCDHDIPPAVRLEAYAFIDKVLKHRPIRQIPSATCLSAIPDYPDHSRLLVYRDADGTEHPVRSMSDWMVRRWHILASMQQVMGPLPPASRRTPLDIQTSERVKGDGYTRLKLSYQAEAKDRVPAYLYLPDTHKNKVGEERSPAMLALHPTSELGKGMVDGQSNRPNRGYARELAQRGYVVLAPDYPSFGDYKDYDFDADDYVSGTMKGIFNHMRGVDLLQHWPGVDPRRIGAIGHSLGGHNAMFVGAFDQRLQVIVSSCGWTPFHDYYGGKLDGWTSPRYMPRIRDVYGLDPDRTPFDFYEVVAALAPRPFFSCSPLHDDNFAVAGVEKAIKSAREIYTLLGLDNNKIQVRYPDCGHDFPPAVRREAYAFIDRALQHQPARDVPKLK